MAGKRPDQHNIDPREAGAADYKSLPQQSHGRGALDDTVELDRQRVGQEEARIRAESGPFNPGKPAPSKFTSYGRPVGESDSASEKEGMKASADGDDSEMSGREREAQGTEDPRERGVGG